MIISLIILVPFLTVAKDREEDLAKQVRSRTKTFIAELTKEEKTQTTHLKRLRKGEIDTSAKRVNIPKIKWARITFPSWDAKVSAIAVAETKLSKTKDKITKYGTEFHYGVFNYLPNKMDDPPKIGDFGKVNSIGQVLVMKVIDSKTMHVQVTYSRLIRFPLCGVFEDVLLKVKSVSTKGAVAGERFDLPQVFEVTDTEEYKTDWGSSTVFVVEPLDTKRIEEHLRQP